MDHARRATMAVAFATLALGPSLGWAAAAQGKARPGIRVRFASLGGQGGRYGRAFLLFSSEDVKIGRLDEATRGCTAGALRVDATARLPRGAIRAVRLELQLPDPDAPVRVELGEGRRCKRARVRTTLEDGRVLKGEQGTVNVDSIELTEDGHVAGRFELTITRDAGLPITIRGSFHVPVR